MHQLTEETPEETINTIINVFCLCLVEAIAYKINTDETNEYESKELIRMAFGASIKSHKLAEEEMLEMCI